MGARSVNNNDENSENVDIVAHINHHPQEQYRDGSDEEENDITGSSSRSAWQIRDAIDAQNLFGHWCPAFIHDIQNHRLSIGYANMPESWKEWIPMNSKRLAKARTKVRAQDQECLSLNMGQKIRVKLAHSPWQEAVVVEETQSRVLVRFPGRNLHHDRWIRYHPEELQPLVRLQVAGRAYSTDHLSTGRSRNFVTGKILAERPEHSTRSRSRVICSGENPQYRQYVEALAQLQLKIVSVAGDGNCLFRSVSHQVYGSDEHHGVVRAKCMDYMQSEAAYFEPYVVGNMDDYMRYVMIKRQDAVWGDDPEIQAMCELYDRPAIVYAYDVVTGAKKLRTFHEHNSSVHRPAINLSYYGGGHYDSIVHQSSERTFLITQPPGMIEQERIEYSQTRRRRQGENGDCADTTNISEQTQMDLALELSRKGFDEQNDNLEELLKASLHEYEHQQATEIEAKDILDVRKSSELIAMQNEMIQTAKKQSEDDHLRKAMEESLQEAPDDAVDLNAAMQASLQDGPFPMSGGNTPDEDVQRALALSMQEFSSSSSQNRSQSRSDHFVDEDELELQRAIQASLTQNTNSDTP